MGISAINHVIVIMIKVFELFVLKEINERNAEPRYIHFVFFVLCFMFYVLFRQRNVECVWTFKP